MKHGDFPVRYVTNYQRVGAKNGGVHPEMFGFYHLKTSSNMVEMSSNTRFKNGDFTRSGI